MSKMIFGILMTMFVCLSASATTIRVKYDENWPDLKVAVDNNWPDCKIKFDNNWPDVHIDVDNNWPDVKVKRDQNWPDIKVKEDNNWPDVKVSGTNDLILAAVACKHAISAKQLQKFKQIFAVKTLKQKCDDDSDCPGFANYCFAGKCQNT